MTKHVMLEEMERKGNLRTEAMKKLMFIEGDSLEANVLRVLVNLNDRLSAIEGKK